jgi:hypothetical protein
MRGFFLFTIIIPFAVLFSLFACKPFAQPAGGPPSSTTSPTPAPISSASPSANPGAGTEIEAGAVSGTWSAAGSPYRVKGDIWISRGSTLKIEPGVEIRFQDNYKIDVFGQIDAQGTASARILFTAENRVLIPSLEYGDPIGSGGWGGVRMQDPEDPANAWCANPDDTMAPSESHPSDTKAYSYDPYLPQVFRYCDFEYANKLIAINPNNTYYENRGGALFFWFAYDITVDHCGFRNSIARGGGGIYYVLLMAEDKVLLSNCAFENCQGLGVVSTVDNPNGGALIANHGYLQMSDVSFINCHANRVGGAAYFFDSEVWYRNISLSENVSDDPLAGTEQDFFICDGADSNINLIATKMHPY